MIVPTYETTAREQEIIINELRSINRTQENRISMQKEEIKRLNNTINELEKWLEEQHQFIIEIPAYTKEIAVEHKAMEICYENVLDKLQELKGDGSNGR